MATRRNPSSLSPVATDYPYGMMSIMSDGGKSGVGQFTEEVKEVASEIVKDVKDEVGQILEQGVQSVSGTQPTPQQLQQKQQEEQQKLAEAQRKIEFWKRLEAEQKAAREQENQKQLQNQETLQQEEQLKKDKEVEKKQAIPSPAKKEVVPGVPNQPKQTREDLLRAQGERRSGRGVGG